jgi:hypothetical protein
VKRRDGARFDSSAAAQATTSPSTSDKLCPASASSATDWLRTPNAASTATKPRFSAIPTAKARLKSAGAPARWWSGPW